MASVDLDEPQTLEGAVRADELGHEGVGRVGQDVVGRVVLDQAAVTEDRDPRGHLHSLVDVVAHEHDRLLQLGLELHELVLDDLAVDRIDGTERLVHQEDRRVGGERADHTDALLLAAGQLLGIALEKNRPDRD